MGKTTRNKKTAEGEPDMSFIDDFFNRSSNSLAVSRTSHTVGRRIHPAAAALDQHTIVHLKAVVTDAVMDKHCVAKTRDGRKCTADTSCKDALRAIQETKWIGSNYPVLMGTLNKIAVLATCKRINFREPHYRQAGDIVDRWMRDANTMAKESLLPILPMLVEYVEMQKHGRPRAIGPSDEGRVQEVEKVDEEEPELRKSTVEEGLECCFGVGCKECNC